MCIRWKGFGGCGCSHGAGEEEFKKMRTDPNVLDIFFRQIRSDLAVFANAAGVPTLPPFEVLSSWSFFGGISWNWRRHWNVQQRERYE